MKRRIFAAFAASLLLAGCTAVDTSIERVDGGEDIVPANVSVAEETVAETTTAAGSSAVSETEVSVTEDTAEEDDVSEVDDIPVDEPATTESFENVGGGYSDDNYYPEDVIPDDDDDYTEATPEQSGGSDETEPYVSDDDVLPEKIELTIYEVTLEKGYQKMPIVTMYPENCDDKSEIWTSSDENVAVVDDEGLITAKGAGQCIITVTAAANHNVKAEVKVTVDAGPQVTYIDGILIVNKSYALPADYNPGLDDETSKAFEDMQEAAAEEGLNIWIASGFRSYEYQKGLYQRYVDANGQAEADTFSARAGHSEHQTGLAIDMNTIDNSFADTAEGKWIAEHCWEYGFIVRYPKGKESITGYQYEPWHIRYLGKSTAKKVFDSGLTLEEYLGIDSKYAE